MNSTRIYTIGASVILVAVVAGLSWALLSDPLASGSGDEAEEANAIRTLEGGGVSIRGRKSYATVEEEVADLRRENERLRARLDELQQAPETEGGDEAKSGWNINIPETPEAAGKVAGNMRRSRWQMQQQFPDGAPDPDSPEYQEYLEARKAMAESMASLMMVRSIMRDATPEDQTNFRSAELSTALELSESDAAAARAVLEANQAALSINREDIPEDRQERREYFREFRDAQNEVKAAVREVLPADKAELLDQIYERGFAGGPPFGRGRGGGR